LKIRLEVLGGYESILDSLFGSAGDLFSVY
jgi:hypothetical protein